MPGMISRELAEQLTTLCPTIRALYTSGYSDNVAESLHFLSKPLTPYKLISKVSVMLDNAVEDTTSHDTEYSAQI